MIHPQFGLWHSYRFALLGTGIEIESAGNSAASAVEPPNASPCLDCLSKPCLHSCPVAAFDAAGYDVERCFDYLRQTPQAACHQQGCLARIACPIAPNLSYVAAQGRFHLRAFLQAQHARSGA
jgi:epoxyqueuosine reductase QueG